MTAWGGTFPAPTYEVAFGLTNILVPSDFVGMHSHRYPTTVGLPDSPAPTFGYGSARTHDSGIGGWRTLNPSSGTFNWTTADAFINTMAGQGKTIIFTVFHTPLWAAKVADQSFAGPYGNLGECGVPNNMADLGTFVTQLVTRYNTSGPRKIQYLEIWNEPSFLQNHTGFYWGSAAELVTMGVTIRNAARAVDSGIQIISPGFTGSTVDIASWLAATDPGSGQQGKQIIDMLAYHPYATLPTNGAFRSVYDSLKNVLFVAGIPTMPMTYNEVGIDSAVGSPTMLAFYAKTTQQRKEHVWRMLAISAAFGIKSFYGYSYSSSLFGDLVADSSGAIAAIDEFHNRVPNKTIALATQRVSDGRVTLNFTDGTLVQM
jgi:hypothetical protein